MVGNALLDKLKCFLIFSFLTIIIRKFQSVVIEMFDLVFDERYLHLLDALLVLEWVVEELLVEE